MNAIHLRLAGEPIRVRDGLAQRPRAIVRQELTDDGREHVAMVAVDPNDPVVAADIDRLLFYLIVGLVFIVVAWALRKIGIRAARC